MSILNKSIKLFHLGLNPQLFFLKTKYIFLFSHMRSRSSALSQVLGSNPQIFGYRELHRSYLNVADLVRMRTDLFIEFKYPLQNIHLFDKLLHNENSISNKIIEMVDPKIIILLRDPESTLKSIINMCLITGVDEYNSPGKALAYYCSRLNNLEEFGNRIGGNYFFIDSDDFINNTDYLLKKLSIWLGLDVVLNKNYSNFRLTGKAGHGDPLSNIKSGIIKKTQSYPGIKLPMKILDEGNFCYKKCRDNLTKDYKLRNIAVSFEDFK